MWTRVQQHPRVACQLLQLTLILLLWETKTKIWNVEMLEVYSTVDSEFNVKASVVRSVLCSPTTGTTVSHSPSLQIWSELEPDYILLHYNTAIIGLTYNIYFVLFRVNNLLSQKISTRLNCFRSNNELFDFDF